MESLNIKIIIGSTREGRFGDKPAKWVENELLKINGVKSEILDLRDYPMGFFNETIPPLMITEPYTDDVVKKWTSKISEGDGFVIITPEYNHGYPAVLKNALDYVNKEWNRKAVGFVSYGSVSGARAVEQLRLVTNELQMAPVRTAVHLPVDKWFPVIMGNGSLDDLFGSAQDNLKEFTEELVWWTSALKTARKK